MKTIVALAFAAALAATPFSFAADPAPKDEHNHAAPAVKSAPNKASKATPAPKAADEQMMKMDAHMKTMREMHEKMAAAGTPDERNALMAEHMKAMQDGMSMMGGMKSGMMGEKMAEERTMPAPMMQKQMESMQKQIDMMQMTMQMMMDRMGPAMPAK